MTGVSGAAGQASDSAGMKEIMMSWGKKYRF